VQGGHTPVDEGLRTAPAESTAELTSWTRLLPTPYAVRTLFEAVRSQRLELRLTEEERSIDQAAATAVGESLSDFFRRAAANRAADVLADQRRIVLSEQEAIRFLDALESVDAHTVARLADLRSRT
jgi:uncharacterized protein (DUF1778 family)